jgi:hypothetical protein
MIFLKQHNSRILDMHKIYVITWHFFISILWFSPLKHYSEQIILIYHHLSVFNKLISWPINTPLLFFHDLSRRIKSTLCRYGVLTAKNLGLLNLAISPDTVLLLQPCVYGKMCTTAPPTSLKSHQFLSCIVKTNSFTAIISINRLHSYPDCVLQL